MQTSDTAAMAAPGVCTSIMTARNKKNGFGTTSNPERFLNQDFQQIRQLYRSKNLRYIDDTFPPNRQSIGTGVLSSERLNRVEWKRPYVSVFVARSQRRDLTSLLSLGSTNVLRFLNLQQIKLNWGNSHCERQSQPVNFFNYVKCKIANICCWSFKFGNNKQYADICIVSSLGMFQAFRSKSEYSFGNNS